MSVSDLPLTQTFSTNFYQLGTSENITQLSGNPGYIVGQPVLAGNRTIGSNGASAIEMCSDRSRCLTMLSSSTDGLCTNNVQNRKPILFGLNMRSGCFISMTYNNMTSLCGLSQQYALEALNGSSLFTHIASFGNTSQEKAGDWVEILSSVSSSLCSVTSNPTSTSPGVCENIITGMNIQIVYANVGAINNPQPQIIGAEYQFICQPALRFQCVGPYCHPSTANTTTQKFEVVSSVNFVDASTPPIGAYGQRPTVSSTLPADFFYPFK
jgi:tectonic-1/3